MFIPAESLTGTHELHQRYLGNHLTMHAPKLSDVLGRLLDKN
jgi:hypothetical protein